MIEVSGKDVTFFVSSSTPVSKLGSAIAHAVYAERTVTLRAIGPMSVSQAMKAVAVASGFTAPRDLRLAVVPSFSEAVMEDKTVTAMAFRVVVL